MSRPPAEVLSEIRIPQETVNDEVVIIADWRVEHGAAVRKQDVVADIETSKAVLELEAETDGFVEILHPKGSELPIGELIGRIVSAPVEQAAAAQPAAGAAARPASSGVSGTTISRKAQRLIEEHGLDVAIFAGLGLVREADVIRHLEQSVASQEAAAPAAGAPPGDYRSRGLFGDASASAGERGRPLPWLIWNYFWRNWLMGILVPLAPRGVINVLHRWRGVRMGKDCFIDPSATLETAYPEKITLGHDVRVTVGAIVMCHIKPPNYLHATGIVPSIVSPVVIDDHAFIGVNAVVMPGVTVGKASVVASGAVVVSNVPPFTMVAGNPAKVVRRFPKPDGEAG